jgi:hypothetical protein
LASASIISKWLYPYSDEELHGFASRLQRRSKVTRLALELRRLERSVGDNYWCVEHVEMALWTQRLFPSRR